MRGRRCQSVNRPRVVEPSAAPQLRPDVPFESGKVGVVRIDTAGTLVRANARFLRMAGRGGGDLPIAWNRIVTRAYPFDGSTRLVRPGGRMRTVLVETVQRRSESRLCLVLDRSTHDRAERRLRQEQRRYRRLSARLAVAEELERRRIAMGLHDRVGQSLALIRLGLGKLPGDPATPERQEILRHLDQALEETRTLTFELSSAVLHELGLEAALRSLAERVTRRGGLLVELVSAGEPIAFDLGPSIVIYRTVRELLLNAVKHARASRATVSLAVSDDQLRVVVSDDGRGFDTSTLSAGNSDGDGFGLLSARHQVAELGGTLRVRSAPGRGTRAFISVPVERS